MDISLREFKDFNKLYDWCKQEFIYKCYEKVGFKIIGEYQSKDTIGNNVEIVVLLNVKG